VLAASLCALSFDVALIEGGCLPEQDLSSYSSAWERRQTVADARDAATDSPAPGAGAGGDAGMAGSAIAGSGGFSVDAGDASAPEPDASPDLVDSGSTALSDANQPLADAAP
jgi:hypothetical protein